MAQRLLSWLDRADGADEVGGEQVAGAEAADGTVDEFYVPSWGWITDKGVRLGPCLNSALILPLVAAPLVFSWSPKIRIPWRDLPELFM